MPRWKPNTKDRLIKAALTLYDKQGFSETTIAQIATEAGLTTRTYYRHFNDKREVLFTNSDEAPSSAETVKDSFTSHVSISELIEKALLLRASDFEADLKFLKARQRVIQSNDELRERELRKRDDFTKNLYASFLDSGLEKVQALIAAKVSVAIFSTALNEWVDQTGSKPLSGYVNESMTAYYSLNDKLHS